MDTRIKYQQVIKKVLQDCVEYRRTLPDEYTSQALFDDERDQYLIIDYGWQGDRYLHATPLHISLIENKIWIQYDDTEAGIATELIAAGVPASDIVLGFRHPRIRKYTDFAVL